MRHASSIRLRPAAGAGQGRDVPVIGSLSVGACLRSDRDDTSARVRGAAIRAHPAGTVYPVDPAELGYDEEAQVGLIRDGADMVPLSKHTDGQTSTVTQGGDGQTTNKDSDTDHRED